MLKRSCPKKSKYLNCGFGTFDSFDTFWNFDMKSDEAFVLLKNMNTKIKTCCGFGTFSIFVTFWYFDKKTDRALVLAKKLCP